MCRFMGCFRGHHGEPHEEAGRKQALATPSPFNQEVIQEAKEEANRAPNITATATSVISDAAYVHSRNTQACQSTPAQSTEEVRAVSHDIDVSIHFAPSTSEDDCDMGSHVTSAQMRVAEERQALHAEIAEIIAGIQKQAARWQREDMHNLDSTSSISGITLNQVGLGCGPASHLSSTNSDLGAPPILRPRPAALKNWRQLVDSTQPMANPADAPSVLSTSASMDFSTSVPPYKLGRRIGVGAYGTVHEGTFRGLPCAIKSLVFSGACMGASGNGTSNTTRKTAILEAAVCCVVNHPNVVSAFHYDLIPLTRVHERVPGEAMDWKLVLVQELCDATLLAALESNLFHDSHTRTPCADLVVGVLKDVAEGMVHLHERGIIHGDLKPENVMLRADPRYPAGARALVMDFGLSTTLRDEQTHVSNFTAGTPFYIAPEVVNDHRVTRASDVFSFGIMAWQVYMNEAPYTWITPAKGQPGRHELNPAFKEMLQQAGACVHPAMAPFVALVKRCLVRDPKQRPTFVEIAREMGSVCEVVKRTLAGDGGKAQT